MNVWSAYIYVYHMCASSKEGIGLKFQKVISCEFWELNSVLSSTGAASILNLWANSLPLLCF